LSLTLSLDGALGFFQLMFTPWFTYIDDLYRVFNNYLLLWIPFYVVSCLVAGFIEGRRKSVLTALLILTVLTSSAAPTLNALESTIRDVPGQPYDVTETGVIGGYSFGEGEYTLQAGPTGSGIYDYVNRPETIVSFTSGKQGSLWISYEQSSPDQAIPIIESHYADVTEWGYSTGPGPWRTQYWYPVNPGTVVEIRVTPDTYESNYVRTFQRDGYDVTEYLQKYHASSGDITFELTYTVYPGDDESILLDADFVWEPETPTVYDEVTFTSTARVEGATITEHKWYIEGIYQSSVGNSESFIWDRPPAGSHAVSLTVVDDQGNQDTYEANVTVIDIDLIITDSATCQGVQSTSPYDPIERTSTFEYLDEPHVWTRFGNVYGSHTVEYQWESGDGTVVRTTTISIPDAAASGYEYWETYNVWDALTLNDPAYDAVMDQPGQVLIRLKVDGRGVATYAFDVPGELSLTAYADKTQLITREKTLIGGELTLNDNPVNGATISVQVYRDGSLVETVPGSATGSNGLFSFEWEVPKVALTSKPTAPEEWSLVVTATTSEHGSATDDFTVQVLPVWLKVKSIHLVQSVEAPVYTDFGGSFPYLAVDKEAGVRVVIEPVIPKGVTGFSNAEVDVRLSRSIFFESATYSDEVTVEVGSEPVPVDFFFTPAPGRHWIQGQIDAYNRYTDLVTMSKEYVDGLKMEITSIAKRMEELKLLFIPMEMGSLSYDDGVAFKAWTQSQVDFIEETYPLPEYLLNTDTYLLSLFAPLKVGPLKAKQSAAVAMLSLISVLEKAKIVGVLPDSNDWWQVDSSGKRESTGYSNYFIRFGTKYTDYFLPYYSRAVLVMYGANEGVTAHEIGHTLGLNRYAGYEEYQVYCCNGKQVEGLVLRGGKIYNITNMDELQTAFKLPNGTSTDRVFCFMGSNEARLAQRILDTWVCDETYRPLFTALKDPPDEPVLYVSGTIYTNRTTEFDNWYLTTGLPDPEDEGEYTVDCVSDAGEVLYSTDFGFEAEEYMSFGFVIPYPEGTVKVRFSKDGELLRERSPSVYPPEINVVTPDSVTTAQGALDLSWAASDLDGDALAYSVLYSPDGGENWMTVALELDVARYSLDTTLLPGGTQGKIKVVVSDGFNTVEEISSGYFTVPEKEPSAYIESPVDLGSYNLDTVTLKGYGFDLEDGTMSESELTWSSDNDGYLGSGSRVEGVSLGPGAHTITLSVVDSDGNRAETSVDITVVGSSSLSLKTHNICLGVDENGDPVGEASRFDPDAVVYSLVNMEGVVYGDEVYWVFEGPGGIMSEASVVLEYQGEVYAYACVDLSDWETGAVKGDWWITVYLNGVEASAEEFAVGGGGFSIPIPWWAPLLGILFFLLAARLRRGARIPSPSL